MMEGIVAVAFFLVTTLGVLVGLHFLDAWWSRSWIRQKLDAFYSRVFRVSRLYPENRFIVEMNDSGISCTRPNGVVERVTWDDLQTVEILNTDEGPYHPDVFWVLLGAEGGCVIPQGATGEAPLLERLQELPGFDNGAVIEAMTMIGNRRTLCWKRPAASA